MTQARPVRPLLLAMALITLGVIVYEIALTRLLSVVLWYHFAFLSISLAMLGLGASGVWLTLRPNAGSLVPGLLSAGIAIPLSVLIIARARPLVIDALGPTGWVALIVVAALVPFYALGHAVCSLLVAAEGRSVGRMYGADLAGGALGAVLVVPLLSWIPTPALLALSGLLPLAALACVASRRVRTVAAGVAVLLVAGVASGLFRVDYNKTYLEEGALAPLYEYWTPTARITAFDRPIYSTRRDVPWGWGYGANFVPKRVHQRWIDQDGSAGTPVEYLRGDPGELAHLPYDVTSAGYQIRRPERVCIIGAGGGRDVATALGAGARDVTAVEINAAIAELMTGPFADFSGDIYTRPGVNAVVSEGRSFLAATDERYDLIQIALVDSWAATAAGAFALSENFLYTVEAFQLYLERLTPGGLLSVSRWTDAAQPFESTRLVALAEAALARAGVAAPREHLLYLSGSSVGSLLVSERPFDAATLARAEQVARQRGFVIDWPRPLAGGRPESPGSLVMEAEPRRVLAESGLDLRPPTDDRPFFFQAVRPFQLGRMPGGLAPDEQNLRSISTLRFVIGLLAALTLALFFAPLLAFGRSERGPDFWRGCGYFALIGAGFMLLEVAWLERCILLLGHPSYAAALVLGTLLFGGGLGSLLSAQLSPALRLRLVAALGPTTAAVALALGPLLGHALGWPVAARLALCTPLLIGVGVLMGLALPTGFLAFGDRHKPWFWALNGASGVLASALSLAFAIEFGLLATSLIGAGCYVAAALLVWQRRPARSGERVEVAPS